MAWFTTLISLVSASSKASCKYVPLAGHIQVLNEQVSACLEVCLVGETDLVEQIAVRHDFPQCKD